MNRLSGRRHGRAMLIGAAIAMLKASVALAACQLPSGTTPGLCTYSGSGVGLTITDSKTTGNPDAILGHATGTTGRGVYGLATGTGGIGGVFQSDAANQNANNAAIYGVNNGGSTTAEGNYGSAGVFTVTNAKNESPGVSITTKGINSYGLSVVNSGTIDNNFNPDQPNNFGGMAGYFEITSAAVYGQSAVYAIATGGAGSAGTFITSNKSNADYTLFAQTAAPNGNAVTGVLTGAGGNGAGVQGYDNTSAGGTAVYGQSNFGLSGYFSSGSGGHNGCSYDGGTTWSCTAPAAMMEDRAKPKLGELLDKLDALPVGYYGLKGAKVPERYLGPSAEDFRAAFGLGRDDKAIRDGNAYGVALAAAKGLYQKLKADEATIAAQDARIALLERENARIAALEGQLAAQATTLARMQAVLARLAPAVIREAKAEDRR
jgi:hypothetical protein